MLENQNSITIMFLRNNLQTLKMREGKCCQTHAILLAIMRTIVSRMNLNIWCDVVLSLMRSMPYHIRHL
jgi:hypothetical protein